MDKRLKDNKDEDLTKIGNYPKFLGLRRSALLEILLFFIFLILLAWFFRIPISYNTVCPHPFWIIVILISVQYGTNEGLIAAIVATCLALLGPYPERVITQDKYQYAFMIAIGPVLWFVAAVILGEIRNRHIRELLHVKEIALSSQEKERVITETYISLKKIKEQLEMRYASQMQTAIMTYNSFKQLEKEDRPGIIKGALTLVHRLITPEKMSIFFLNEDKLKLVASEGWSESEIYNKEFSSSSPLFQKIVINKNGLCIVNAADRDILKQEGALAVPIHDVEHNSIFGMIKIEEIPFIRLRKITIETCKTIGEWIGAAYARALEVDQAIEGQFMNPKSGLLTPSFLQYQTSFLTQLGKRLKINITLLRVVLEGIKTFSEEKQLEIVNTFRHTIKETLRAVDQAFEYNKKEGEFSILLINANVEATEIVKTKLLQALANKLNKDIRITCTFIPLYEKQ